MTGKIIIHCVRHAQGFHNLCDANQYVLSPLTPTVLLTQIFLITSLSIQAVHLNS